MPQRQFSRCVEMALLKGLLEKEKDGKKSSEKKKKDKQWKMFRLIVKGRVYKQNRDVLAQLDRLDRIDKLEETYFHVEDEYKRLLQNVRHGNVEEGGSDEEKNLVGEKRASETEEEEELEMGGRPKKRVRF